MLQKARGTFVPAEQFNAVVDEVNRLSSILSTLGPGLELVGGRGLGLNLNRLMFGDPNCPRVALTQTPGTQNIDLWAIEDDGRIDGNGVEEQVLTDVYWDAGAEKIMARWRTNKWDKYGRLVAVTAEGTPGTEVKYLHGIEYSLVTDVEMDSGTLKHDKRTFTIIGTVGAETTDTVLAPIVREVVTDVEYNTGTYVLSHDKRTLTVLGTEGAEGTDTINTADLGCA